MPCLISKLIITHRNYTSFSRRLNVESMKQLAKQIKKMSCGNALITFSLMANDAKNYENMHEAQLLAIAGCGELSFDIVAFSCLSKLADTSDSHFDVEGNYAKWLQNITEFAGSFFKRYPNVEITPLFTYLCHMIRDEE